MKLSPSELGSLVDSWSEANQAGVVETTPALTVSRLTAAQAIQLASSVPDEWQTYIADNAGEPARIKDLDDTFGPFVLTVPKPVQEGELRFLTLAGLFSNVPDAEHGASWQIARAKMRFATGLDTFGPWGTGDVFAPAFETKSPVELVREVGETRVVPSDIRRWLVRSQITDHLWNDVVFRAFVKLAAPRLIRSLANEVIGPNRVVFIGPPRTTRDLDDLNLVDELQIEGYANLHQAASWVYEDRGSAEQRHALLASEIARTAARDEPIGSVFRVSGKVILEGARLAFQLSLSELSREALRAQADLRRSIADDVSKASEGTRSIANATVVAIATGIGLVAARVSGTGDPRVLSLIAIVVALYLGAVVLSGVQYLRLQKWLRKQWRERFYKFIPTDDYMAMADEPARKAAIPLYIMSFIGGTAAVVLLALAVVGWSGHRDTLASSSAASVTAMKGQTTGSQTGQHAQSGKSNSNTNSPQDTAPPKSQVGHN